MPIDKTCSAGRERASLARFPPTRPLSTYGRAYAHTCLTPPKSRNPSPTIFTPATRTISHMGSLCSPRNLILPLFSTRSKNSLDNTPQSLLYNFHIIKKPLFSPQMFFHRPVQKILLDSSLSREIYLPRPRGE